jgi:hypothetical protein
VRLHEPKLVVEPDLGGLRKTRNSLHNLGKKPMVADPCGLCKARNSLSNVEREGFVESSPAQTCNIYWKGVTYMALE